MGCGLRKIRHMEDNSPGKIYSTLKRPQVETQIGISYKYQHIDFLVGKDDAESSVVRVSSVRELPSHLLDLYQEGFILSAVHPFIHQRSSTGSGDLNLQHRLYRALLLQVSESSEKNPADFESYHLKLEECLSADQIPSTEHIQGYVKKQVQDAADQGIMFVGFIQEPAGLHPQHLKIREAEEPEENSLSLHSSPSSLHGSGLTTSPSPLEDPEEEANPQENNFKRPAENQTPQLNDKTERTEENSVKKQNSVGNSSENQMETPEEPEGADDDDASVGKAEAAETPAHDMGKVTYTPENNCRALKKSRGELFGLFNYPGRRSSQLKYYTVKIPLRLESGPDGICALDGNWLDHMTQHFNSGASLVDGYFQISNHSDDQVKMLESVFIFQEGAESNINTVTAYDAIVVEQWTIMDGLEVKADYLPLLQSLASFGWRLTCVLPTPIIKRNSDGSLATKQIVFLQRPVLPRKKKDSKKVIFKTRNKSNKNSVKDVPKNKKKKESRSAAEKEIHEQKACGRAERSHGDAVEQPGNKLNNESTDETKQKQEETETATGSEVGGSREKQEVVGGSRKRGGVAMDEFECREGFDVTAETESGLSKDNKHTEEDNQHEPPANQQ